MLAPHVDTTPAGPCAKRRPGPCTARRPPLALLVVSILAACLLAGCATSAPRPAGKGTQRPYTIKGKTYRPLPDARGYSEQCQASWYEPGWFSGNITANGERLRSGAMTCAHKILPINTMLRVTNMENGREIVVRVNDRGPFVSGRCIDLTPAGAKALGFYAKGGALVRVSVEGDIPGGEADNPPGPFYVQVGAFAMRENAEALAGRLARTGYAQTRMQEKILSGQRLWLVQAGTFATLNDARGAQQALAGEFPDAFVIAQ